MNLRAKLSIAGEPIYTEGSSSWDNIKNKPFSKVDTENGLTIQDDTLMIDTLDHIATIDYVDTKVAEIPEPPTDYVDTATFNTLQGQVDQAEEDIADLQAVAITQEDLDEAIPTNVSELNNDAGYVTSTEAQQTITALPDNSTIRWNSNNKLETVFNGSYNNLTDKPEIYGIGYGTRAHSIGNNQYLDALSGQGLITSQYDGVQLQQGEGVFVTESWGKAIASCNSPYTSMSINWDAAANLPMAIAIAYTKDASNAGGLYGVIRTGYVHVDGTDRILEGLEDICTYTNGNTTTSIVLTLNSGLYFTKLSSRTTSSTWALRSYNYTKGWYQSSAKNIPIDSSTIKINSDGNLFANIPVAYGTANEDSIIIGNSVASATGSLGVMTDSGAARGATAQDAIAIGRNSQATGQHAIAIGYQNSAKGPNANAVAIGNQNEVEAFSVGIGGSNKVSSQYAYVIGQYNNESNKSIDNSAIIGKSNSFDTFAVPGTGLSYNSGTHIAIGLSNKNKGHQTVSVGNGLVTCNESVALGRYNYDDTSTWLYRFSVGDGADISNRSNSLAIDSSKNLFSGGDIYTNVTDWSDPQNNSIKLANIPACPTTTAGTFSLQATIDSNGNVTYSWV